MTRYLQGTMTAGKRSSEVWLNDGLYEVDLREGASLIEGNAVGICVKKLDAFQLAYRWIMDGVGDESI